MVEWLERLGYGAEIKWDSTIALRLLSYGKPLLFILILGHIQTVHAVKCGA